MLDVKQIREDFPILNTRQHGCPLIYLDNAATMQMPQPVLEQLVSHYHSQNGNVHRGVHSLSQKSTSAMERARERIAAYIGAKAEEIIFTAGNGGWKVYRREIGPGSGRCGGDCVTIS